MSDGNLTSETDPDSSTTTFTYDELDWRLVRTLPAVGTAEVTEATTYDALGRQGMLQEIDHYQSTNAPGHGATPNETVGYAYDSLGSKRRVEDSTGATTSYAYDAFSEITGVTRSSGGVSLHRIHCIYVLDIHRLTEVLVNGSNTTSTTDTYDARDRLTGETVTINGSPTSATTDTYDSNGSLVQSQTTIGTQTTANTYSYDARGRLLTAQVNGSSAKQEVG